MYVEIFNHSANDILRDDNNYQNSEKYTSNACVLVF